MSDSGIDTSIFRAYDIRGIVPAQLNAADARAIGRALATKAMTGGTTAIAVARDGRDSSPELAAALIDGIVAEGIDTLDLGLLPTPTAYWAAGQHTGGSCAVITGSHNPREYNGIKPVLDGVPLTAEELQQLHLLISESRYAGKGVTGMRETMADAAARYQQALLAGRGLARPVKVVVDCGNGAMGPFAPAALRALGCEVVELFCEVDSGFPNHHPDPADPDNWQAAVAALEESGAELALAFDGDGDRLGVWLPGSGMYYPDRLLMLLARKLLAERPGSKVVYDVKCSVNVAPFIAAAGGQPHLCRTGHSFMKRELAALGAPLGGELSGHFFFNDGDWRFDDALRCAVEFLQLVAAAPSAQRLCDQMPDSHATPEYKIEVESTTDVAGLIASLNRAELYPDVSRLVNVDGVRAEWEDGFGLVRASNTTPSLILRFEGADAQACARIQQLFRAALLSVAPMLALPF